MLSEYPGKLFVDSLAKRETNIENIEHQTEVVREWKMGVHWSSYDKYVRALKFVKSMVKTKRARTCFKILSPEQIQFSITPHS